MTGRPLLTATGIVKVLGEGPAAVRALKGVDLTLRGGELTLLMGPSGSGKTTLLSIFGCILSPTSGQLTIGSQSITDMSAERLAAIRRRLVGFVFQSYNLFPTLTVEENIRLALDVRGKNDAHGAEDVRKALREVGLGDKIRALPNKLSGGQKQRVAIARALAGSPAVILADEPTSALDSENGLAIMRLLADIAKDPTRAVLAVTHDSRTLPYADRIIRIEDGHIVGDEEPRKMAQTSRAGGTSETPATETGTKSGGADVVPLRESEPVVAQLPFEPEPAPGPWRRRLAWTGAIALAGLGWVIYDPPSNLPQPVAHAVAGVRSEAVRYKDMVVPPPPPPAPAVARWAAVAPGRVEGRNGEFRVASAMLGRIAEVLVKVGDRVEVGDLLVRLEDEELRVQSRANDAESRSAKRERDAVAAANQRETDLRRLEDKVDTAQRLHWTKRGEFDHLVQARRFGQATDEEVTAARAEMTWAAARLNQDLVELRDFKESSRSPAPTMLDTSLAVARARHAAAEATIEKTRIRAPSAGSVLQVHAKVGEIVAPIPDQTMIVLGDLQALRVRAEVSERDLGKVKVGQAVSIKVDAYPEQEFAGRVASLAPALSPPKLGPRGPRKPLDVDALEVIVELEGAPPLLPGMRTDVFFKLP